MLCMAKMEHLRSSIVNNKKDSLKRRSKSRYMSQNVFANDLVAIHKNKVTLKHKETKIC